MDFRLSFDTIYIGEFECSIEDFKAIEPAFVTPDAEHLHYKKNVLTALVKDENQFGDDLYNWDDIEAFCNKEEHYKIELAKIEAIRNPPYVPTYADLRNAERGTAEEQIEYLIENGLASLIAKDRDIRSRYPKPIKGA